MVIYTNTILITEGPTISIVVIIRKRKSGENTSLPLQHYLYRPIIYLMCLFYSTYSIIKNYYSQ
jgi:predicted neutral ceramidase superfamily lipid hydrolase